MKDYTVTYNLGLHNRGKAQSKTISFKAGSKATAKNFAYDYATVHRIKPVAIYVTEGK